MNYQICCGNVALSSCCLDEQALRVSHDFVQLRQLRMHIVSLKLMRLYSRLLAALAQDGLRYFTCNI
jgi:hypothetical protein